MHKSLREALANALIHADYYGRQGIVIEKEFRKLKLSNPGTFRISIDDAISGGISDARNGRIFNMFSLIKVGERSGMGLCDLFTIWQKSGYGKPVIQETIEPDRITLTLQIETVANRATSSLNRTDQVDQATDQADQDAVETRILAVIRENPKATQTQIAAALNISKSSVKYYVGKLTKAEILKREGTSQKGKWIL